MAWFERRADLFEHSDQPLRFLVAARARGLGVFRHLLFHRRQVRQRKLGVDRLDVGDRVDLARDMHDVAVLEAAHDVRDRVGLADVRQKLVAEPFAFGRAGDQSRDIHEFDGGREHALRARDRRQRRKPRIGHLDDADVGLDRAERIVFCGDAGLGQRVEQCRLADIGQSDDAAFDAHEVSLFAGGFALGARVQFVHRPFHFAGGKPRPDLERARERVVDGRSLGRRRRPQHVVRDFLLRQRAVARMADADAQSPEIAGAQHRGDVFQTVVAGKATADA